MGEQGVVVDVGGSPAGYTVLRWARVVAAAPAWVAEGPA
jgi:hypothetical protein